MTDPIVSANLVAPPASTPGRLLAALLSAGSLVQAEPALTRAVRFLLGLPGATGALDGLLRTADLEPEPGGYWLTEVGHESGGRTDLEYFWGGDTRPRVVVEAKIGHALEASQLRGYRSRLHPDGGLLVILVPKSRARAGASVVEELRSHYLANNDPVQVALWSWDEVATELEAALPNNPDVVQLRGLIDAAGALDILPFTHTQLRVGDRSRFEDLSRVLDRASFGLFDQRLPLQYGGPFERWRYVSVGAFGASYQVGIGRRNRSADEPWVWASVYQGARFGRVAQEALRVRYPDDAIQDGQDVVVPITLTDDFSGVELSQHIEEQLHEIAATIRSAVVANQEAAAVINAGKPAEAPADLAGIPILTATDLLDTSTRRDDIVTIARAALRSLPGGSRRIRFRRHEPFAERAWIGIEPHATHISLGIERTDPSATPRPWVWVSVHEVTPSSALAYRVLDELFPAEAVDIPNGHGLPIRIPADSNGVDAFHAVRAHLIEIIDAIRSAIPSDVSTDETND